MSIAEGSALRTLCRQRGRTINDALVAALSVATKRITSKGRLGGIFTMDLRRHLPDPGPRLTNLSAALTIALKRQEVSTLAGTIDAVGRANARHEARGYGLPWVLGVLSGSLLPHSFARFAARALIGYAKHLLTRGLMVTNIGRLDPYMEPFGDLVTDTALIGPFLRGVRVPLVTATGFRDELTIRVCGHLETMAGPMDQIIEAIHEVLPE